MPQQFLHRFDIIISFQQVSREAVPEFVAAPMPGDARFADRCFDHLLQNQFVEMMPVFHPRSRVL